jgi:hypothetical protein
VHRVHGYISSIALWVRAFCHYSLIASVEIGMFYNQHNLNHSDNKLWAGMFQTSLINPSYYLHFLFISFVTNVTDIYRPHVVILVLWKLDRRSSSYLVKLIQVQSIYTLVMLSSSTSSFSDVIAFCHFWWVICFSSLQSLSSESRDEILFRGEGCDSLCICNARQIFC